MQGVTIDASGEPIWRDLPEPTLGVGELLLGLRWSGLCGTDLFKLATGGAAPGAVLGHEIVGEVLAVDRRVTRFAPGDRLVVPHHVACGTCLDCRSGAETQCTEFRENLLSPGGFAERIVVRERALRTIARAIPEALDDLDAIFLEPAACVLRSLRKCERVAPQSAADGGAGENSGLKPVAGILGGGSMGLLHLLVLRALGAPVKIVVVDPRADRRALALDLGADAASPPGEEFQTAVRAASADGRGADAVFDCVGGSATASAALSALRPGGTVVLFAHGRAGEPAGFVLNDLFKTEKRLVGAYSGGLAEQEEIWRLLVDGRLRPSVLVSHRLPLSEFAAGLALAREQRALKVAFHP